MWEKSGGWGEESRVRGTDAAGLQRQHMSSARGGAGGGSKPASAGRQRARRRSRADTREQRAARPRSGAKRRTSITGGAEKQRGRRARRRSSAAAADDDLGEDELAEDHSAGWQARLNVAISNAKKTGILDLSSNLTGTCFRFDLAVVPQVVFTQLGGPAKDGRAPLRDLWLSNNLISSVPLSLAKFQDLKVLSFANNDIESFPLAVCALTQLESLHLNGNQLSAVPPQLERLQSLVEVRLDDNELSRFPTALTKLRKLRSLNLSFNDIDSIPADIRRLGSLVQLDLDNNRIGPAVPRELLHLRSLRVVGLANNHLEEMPPFGKVSGGPELEVLRIEGNRSGSFAIRHESGMLLEGVNSAVRRRPPPLPTHTARAPLAAGPHTARLAAAGAARRLLEAARGGAAGHAGRLPQARGGAHRGVPAGERAVQHPERQLDRAAHVRDAAGPNGACQAHGLEDDEPRRHGGRVARRPGGNTGGIERHRRM